MNAERHLKLVDTNGELAGSLCPDCVRTEAALRAERAKVEKLKTQLLNKRKRINRTAQVVEVLEYWRDRCRPRAILEAGGGERFELVSDRLDDKLVGRDSWTVRELKLAVEGALVTPWMNGTAPGKRHGTQYLDAKHVFKSAERVEELIHVAEKFEHYVGVFPSEVLRKLIGRDMAFELEDCSCGHIRIDHARANPADGGRQGCLVHGCHCEDFDDIDTRASRWLEGQRDEAA